jgi:cob(I)alamin adenosyltransferase
LGDLEERERQLVIDIQTDLYIAMAELATLDENRHKLEPGKTQVTEEMVTALEAQIGHYYEGFDMPTEFVIPGSGATSGLFDFARTVVRRAEREAVALGQTGEVIRYLNRLSDVLWTLARWSEAESIRAREQRVTKEQRNEGK